MPMPLMIFYRVLGIVFLALAVATLREKYRTVHGAMLLSGRILECHKADRANPRAKTGGYRYLVEICPDGQQMELETNDSFFLNHAAQKGKTIQVWYNPANTVLERKSFGTELLCLVMAVIGVVLLVIR